MTAVDTGQRRSTTLTRRPDRATASKKAKASKAPATKRGAKGAVQASGPKLQRRRVRSATPERTPSVWKAGLPRRRLIAVLVSLGVAFGLVLARVAFLQTVGADPYLESAAQQRARVEALPADRGVIFASGGEALALSIPSTTLWANPSKIEDPIEAARKLAAVLGLSDDQRVLLQRSLASDKQFVYISRAVDENIAEAVKALEIPGVGWLSEPKRVSPGGDVARSIIGRTNVDGTGISGLELRYDDLLRPTIGRAEREIAGRNRSIPGTEKIAEHPVPGDDLVLTINRPLQFAAEEALIKQVEALGAKNATAIVMDTDTGDILVNATVRRDTESDQVLVSSANLAVTDMFEPGSVSKVITMAAALNEGTVTPETIFGNVPMQKKYDEWTVTDATNHRNDMSVTEIMALSSNNGTVMVSRTLDGAEERERYLRLFGLGEKTALDLPDESAGIVRPASEWNDVDNVTIAYGYGAAATAMQLVAAVNAVANRGTYVAPRLVASVIDEAGQQRNMPPSATREVIKPSAAADLTEMMEAVVCIGTAHSTAPIPGMSVAGKTGTAFKAQDNGTYRDDEGRFHYRATFAGFFPAEAPEVTILVTVDEPNSGGARHGSTAAGPVFNQLAQSAIRELGITSPVPNGGCD